MGVGFDQLGQYWFLKIRFGDPCIMPELILVNKLPCVVFHTQLFTQSFTPLLGLPPSGRQAQKHVDALRGTALW